MVDGSLLKNSLFNIIYKVLNVIFPVFSLAFVSRIITPDNIGKVTYAQNIGQYFLILVTNGLLHYATREIAIKKGERGDLGKVFSELFIINTFLTAIAAIAYYILINSVSFFSEEKYLYKIIGLSLVFNFFNFDWFYQGIEEYGYITKRSLIIKIISILLLIFMVRDSEDYCRYAFINCLAVAGNHLFNIIHISKYNLKLSLKGLEIAGRIKPLLLLIGTSITIELYTLLDTTMLGIIGPKRGVAFYSYAISITKTIIGIITAISGVLLPRISYYCSKGEDTESRKIINSIFEILSFCFMPIGVGLMLVSEELIVLLFGTQYYDAVLTLKISSMLIYTLGFSNLFGIQVLIPFGAEKDLYISTMVGAMINILLNSYLIPLYGQNGAAFASVVSELIVTVLVYRFAQKFIRIDYDKKYWFTLMGSVTCMIIVIYVIERLDLPIIWNLLLKIICGGVSYIGLNLILHNKRLKEIIVNCKRAVRKEK